MHLIKLHKKLAEESSVLPSTSSLQFGETFILLIGLAELFCLKGIGYLWVLFLFLNLES